LKKSHREEKPRHESEPDEAGMRNSRLGVCVDPAIRGRTEREDEDLSGGLSK
jgi:hypothetical protein